MARTPMVIMWANSDGSITLSQRQASGEVEPTVVSSPPRVATLQDSLSVVRFIHLWFRFSTLPNSTLLGFYQYSCLFPLLLFLILGNG